MKLSTIIYRYISQASYTNSQYRRLYDIGVRGVKEIEIDVTSFPKVARLSVLPNKTCKIPSDCVNILNVGVENGLGQFGILKRDNTLTGYRKDSDLRLEQESQTASVDTTRVRDFAFINSMDGNMAYKAFGAYNKTTLIGNYKIEDNTIILNAEFGFDYLLIEYMATIDETDVEVPEIAEEAVISYIAWKDSQYSPTSRKMNLSEKQLRRSEFYNQKRLLKARVHPFLPSEARDVTFDNEKLIIK